MKSKYLSSLPLAIFAASCAQTWAAEPVTVVFQNGLKHPGNPALFYNGAFDRQITKTGGSSGVSMNIDGGNARWGDEAYTNVLLRFDNIENVIPQGAKIIEAKLTVVTGTGGNDHSGDIFQVYRLTREFDETSSMATLDGVIGFGEDGVIGDSDWLVATFQPPNVTGGASTSTDITRAVQSWVDGSPNYGIGINPNRGTNAWIFNSTSAANAALRPKLQVTYVVGDDAKSVDYQQGLNGYTGAFEVVLNANGATSTKPGNSVLGSNLINEQAIDGLNPANAAEPDIPGLIRFDGIEQSIAGRKIEKATLKFVTGGFGKLEGDVLKFINDSSQSPGPFTLHRLLVPFNETTKYGPTGDFNAESGKLVTAGKITPSITTYTDLVKTEVIDADVTQAVQAWAAGAPNHGFYVGASTSDAWAIYLSGATETARRPVLSIVSSEAPPVTVASPLEASRHTLGTPFDFQATTTSPASKVEFLVNGKSFQSDTTDPFSVSYPADKLGNFKLRALMTRPDQTTVSSKEVNFSVMPPAGTGGLYFNGETDHVTLGNPAELKLTTFTLETWFRRETQGTATNTGGVVAIPLIAKGREQTDVSSIDMNWFLGIRESDGVLCADFEGTGATAAAGGGVNAPVVGRTPVPFGQWQHAAATFDGTRWRLYLNGSLEAVVDAPKINGAPIVPRADSLQPASIASALNSSGLPEGAFGGFIDEARVWNVARTQVQIRESIKSELQSANGLVARFGMTEGTGTSITSSVAPNLVGTFVGAPMWAGGQSYDGNIYPTIRFLSPENDLSIRNTTPLTYTVEASDPDGTITKVEYYDNDILVGTVTTAPYSFTYNAPPVAMRRMVAVVYDNAGGTGRTDNIISTFVNYNSPTIPGYTVGIIDGKDADLATGTPQETPAANPAPWSVVASTATPRAFTGLGTDSGDIAVNINGSPAPFDAGVLLSANFSINGNLAPVDNIVAPYNADGVYRVSSRDNSGPADEHPTVAPESSSFSLGWFPFAQGWTGANVAADGTIIAGSSNLPATARIIRPTNDEGVIAGTYQIYGLPMTGNVIVISTGNNSDNVASVVRSGDNWVVTTRDNLQILEDNDFAILYIPNTATRVLSGWLNQKESAIGGFETTALNDDLATLGFTVVQSSRGYELTFGDGTVINPSNTALFICADNNPGQSNNGGDNIYHYSAVGNSFLIFSHDLPSLNLSNQSSGFRFLATPINPTLPGANEVSITPIKNSAAEDDADATLKFQVVRSGATGGPLTVNYTVGGTAASGSDFTALTGSVTIPAGQSSTELVVSLLKDDVLEQNETVVISLAEGAGYTAGSSTSVSAVILDSKPVVPTTTLVFQEGTNSYTGQFQLQISDEGTTRLGSLVEVYGVDGGIPDVNDLMRFDNIIGSGPGRIPTNAKILDASLTITVGGSANDTSPGPFLVDRLKVPFDANTTYDSISNGNSGPLEGARNGSARTPVAGFPRLPLNAIGSANVTNIVREWVSGMPNYGFSIYDGGTSDALSYGTVGHKTVAKRPKLTVTYTTVPVREYTLFADRSALISYKADVPTKDGATLMNHVGAIVSKPNESQEAFMRFPFAFDGSPGAIPADEKIIKAELLIHTNGAGGDNDGNQTNTPVGIHQVLQDWDTTTSYGLNGPRIGEHVAESTVGFTGLGENSTTWVDVTTIVRNWRAGAPNFGLNFRPMGADDWRFHFPGAAANFAPRLRILTISADTPVETPFETWAASFGASGIAMNSDDDHDGITALVEYALGFNPTTANVLPGIVRNGNEFSLSFTKGALASADPRISYRIVSSTDLSTWTPEASAVNDPASITLTHSIGTEKKFFRLEVIHTP